MAGWKLRKDKTAAAAPDAESETAAPVEEPIQNGHVQELNSEFISASESGFRQEEPIVLDPTPFVLDPALVTPDFDADFHFTDLDFDSDEAPLNLDEAPLHLDEAPLHLNEPALDPDEAPLTLVDYTEPIAMAPPEEHSIPEAFVSDPIAPEPPVFELPSPTFELPTPVPPDEPVIPTDEAPVTQEEPRTLLEAPAADFVQRLRTGRDLPFEPVPVSAPAYTNGSAGSGLSDFSPSIPSVAPFVLDTPAPAATLAAAPQLVVRIGRLSATYPLAKEVTTIGRPDSALHYYPDVEIEMDDAVSRRHAEVVKRADTFCLVDTGSTNGTLLNGEKLPPHEERLLAHGDRIRVGDRTEIIFE